MINRKTVFIAFSLFGIMLVLFSFSGCASLCHEDSHWKKSSQTEVKILEINDYGRLETSISEAIKEIENNKGKVISVSGSEMKLMPQDTERIVVIITYQQRSQNVSCEIKRVESSSLQMDVQKPVAQAQTQTQPQLQVQPYQPQAQPQIQPSVSIASPAELATVFGRVTELNTDASVKSLFQNGRNS